MSAVPDRRLTVEELLTLQVVGDAELSADGGRFACTVAASTAQTGELPCSRVWAGEVGGAAARAVTEGPGRDALPRFSPDGTRLAFASDRGGRGRMELHVLALGGAGELTAGAPVAVGEVPGSVEGIRWSSDGARLLVLAAEGAEPAAGSEPGAGEGGGRRLFLVEPASGATHEAGPAGLAVWEMDWSGVGPAVAVVSDRAGESDWYAARIALLDLAARTERTLHVPTRQLQSPAISADGRRVAFVEGLASDRGEVAGTATVVETDAAGMAAIRLAPEHDLACVRWLGDGALLGAGPAGLENACVRIEPGGAVAELWRGPATLGRMSAAEAACSADGRRLLAAKAAPGEPPELALLEVGERAGGPAAWTPLTAVNAPLAGRAVPSAERFAWAARDGRQIEGVLLRPPAAAPVPAGPLPLLVCVHGGPANAWSFDYASGVYGLALAAGNAGCAVLLPNPRGSTGRGQAFAQAVLGDVGGEDLHDLLTGVEALVAAGVADRGRVAISGTSYGGFMSAWAITQSDAFAAAIPFACVADWRSFHGTTEIPAFDELFVGGDPSDPAGAHVTRSPVARAGGASTPTLILHGEDDPCAPAGQSRELHEALAAAGCEAELVLYPRGLHRWWEREQLHDTLTRTLAWLERHLGLEGGRS